LRQYLVLISALMLAGCAATFERYEPPAVDSYGHSPQQLAADQHECIEKKRAHGFVGDGRMITDCMEAKGYTVLAPKG
jgi:hypothetical protein